MIINSLTLINTTFAYYMCIIHITPLKCIYHKPYEIPFNNLCTYYFNFCRR